jgi:dihydrofolate reductase
VCALQGWDILIAGSGALVRTLMPLDLIGEYQLRVYPVVLGSGKLLFQNLLERLNLKLVSSKTFSSGVVLLRYRPNKKTPIS